MCSAMHSGSRFQRGTDICKGWQGRQGSYNDFTIGFDRTATPPYRQGPSTPRQRPGQRLRLNMAAQYFKQKISKRATSKNWQWLFPSQSLSADPQTGTVRRHHISTSAVQKAMKSGLRRSGVLKQASVHTLRHPSPSSWCRSSPDPGIPWPCQG